MFGACRLPERRAAWGVARACKPRRASTRRVARSQVPGRADRVRAAWGGPGARSLTAHELGVKVRCRRSDRAALGLTRRWAGVSTPVVLGKLPSAGRDAGPRRARMRLAMRMSAPLGWTWDLCWSVAGTVPRVGAVAARPAGTRRRPPSPGRVTVGLRRTGRTKAPRARVPCASLRHLQAVCSIACEWLSLAYAWV